METIVVALIGGVVTLLVALFAVGPKLSALGKQLEGHNKESDSRKAFLSTEHGALSKDLSYIHNTVTYLKEDRLKEIGQREAMKGQTLETHKALDVLNTSLAHMANLEAKLAEARQEISALRSENEALRRELASEKGQEEWGSEL